MANNPHAKLFAHLFSLSGEEKVKLLENFPSSAQIELRRVLTQLPAKLERLVRLRFGIDCTKKSVAEIAAELGMKKERVSSFLQWAYRKLRKRRFTLAEALVDGGYTADWLKEFLGQSMEAKIREYKKLPIKERPIDVLDVSQRTLSVLKAADIQTIGGLLDKDFWQLWRIHGFGRKSLNEVQAELEKLGFKIQLD